MKKVAIIIIFGLSLILPQMAYSEEWGQILKGLEDSYIVPVPPYAEEVNKETSQIMGNDCLITIYNTKVSFAEIAKFYRQHLVQDGWEDVSQDKNVKQAVKADLFSDMLIFKKGSKMVNIQNLSGIDPRGKTSFSVARTTFSFSSQIQEEQEVKVASYERAKDIPAYPRAAVNDTVTFNTALGEQWGYTTSDSAESVLDFYRQNMPAKGWRLEQDSPVLQQAYNPQDLKNCPECSKKIQAQLGANMQNQLLNTSVKGGSLQFSRGKEVCMIAVTEILGPASNTVISVLYRPEGEY